MCTVSLIHLTVPSLDAGDLGTARWPPNTPHLQLPTLIRASQYISFYYRVPTKNGEDQSVSADLYPENKHTIQSQMKQKEWKSPHFGNRLVKTSPVPSTAQGTSFQCFTLGCKLHEPSVPPWRKPRKPPQFSSLYKIHTSAQSQFTAGPRSTTAESTRFLLPADGPSQQESATIKLATHQQHNTLKFTQP